MSRHLLVTNIQGTPCHGLAREIHPPPNPIIWRNCERFSEQYEAEFILENVRGAQPFMGKAKASFGPFYLWGDVPPILPTAEWKRKESFSSKRRAERAEIPFDLALAIGKSFLWKLNSK